MPRPRWRRRRRQWPLQPPLQRLQVLRLVRPLVISTGSSRRGKRPKTNSNGRKPLRRPPCVPLTGQRFAGRVRGSARRSRPSSRPRRRGWSPTISSASASFTNTCPSFRNRITRTRCWWRPTTFLPHRRRIWRPPNVVPSSRRPHRAWVYYLDLAINVTLDRRRSRDDTSPPPLRNRRTSFVCTNLRVESAIIGPFSNTFVEFVRRKIFIVNIRAGKKPSSGLWKRRFLDVYVSVV